MGCTYDLDDSLGRLLAKLKELGIENNTLLVFTSDNGGVPASSQDPLRGNKGGYYEGGIREPMIVRWPAIVKPGSTTDVPVINQDFYPTFLAAAGAVVPAGVSPDGESLLPLLEQSGPLRRKSIFWHFPGYLNDPVNRGRDPVFRTRPVTVMRSGDWKIHLYHEEWQLDGGRDRISSNNSVEIYNLKDDIGERHNLASSAPETRDRLLEELLGWIKTSGAPLPSDRNPAYAPNTDLKTEKKRKRTKNAPAGEASDDDS